MIRETLKAMNGSPSLKDMATKLGVGQEDVRQRLDILEEKGLVLKAGDSAGCPPAACTGCHCTSCAPASGGITYFITDKGKKLLDRA